MLTSQIISGVPLTLVPTVLSAVTFSQTTALTATVQDFITFSHETTGTAAAGFGIGLLWQLESTTTTSQSAGRIDVVWGTATHASRKAFMVFSVYDTAVREAMRFETDGSYSLVGIGGSTKTTTRLMVNTGAIGYVGIVIQAAVSQTANLQTWEIATASSPAQLGYITASGNAAHITRDAATSTTSNGLLIGHDSSGTPAVGFGTSIAFQLESTTTEDQDAALIEVKWQTATHASRAADLILYAYNTSNAREGIRIRGGASNAQVGVFGVTPVSQQSTTGTTAGFSAGASTAVRVDATFTGNTGSTAYTIGDIVLALKNFGIMAA